MNKEEFEKSFSGYHKDAPGFLKKAAAGLKKKEVAKKMKGKNKHGEWVSPGHWVGKNSRGGKFESPFGGRDNS